MSKAILVTAETNYSVDFSVKTDGVIRNYTATAEYPAIKKFVYAVGKGAGYSALNKFKQVATITNTDKKESLVDVLKSLL